MATKKTNTKKPSAKKVLQFNESQKAAAKKKRLEELENKSKLTYFHKNQVVPLVVEKLQKTTTKNQIVSGPEISASIYKHHGIKISGSLLRSMLHYIRVNGLVKCLVATTKGYYVTTNTLEMRVYLKSLTKRIKLIGVLRKALDYQSHEVLGRQYSSKVKTAA